MYSSIAEIADGMFVVVVVVSNRNWTLQHSSQLPFYFVFDIYHCSGKVLQYPILQDNPDKSIDRRRPLDDHEGGRTVDALTNARGIGQ